MSVENFTYTGSPWGYTAPGWTVFQRSPGLAVKSADSWMRYFRYRGTPGDPVQFVYIGRHQSGVRFMSQSVDSGLRWYDESRGHDYFAHVFVENNPSRLDAGFNPLSLFRSPDVQTEFPEALRNKAQEIMKGARANEEPPTLAAWSSFAGLTPNPCYAGDALFDGLGAGATAKLYSVAAAFEARIATPGLQPLVFDAGNANSLKVAAAALSLLPPSLRHAVSFSTFAPPGGPGSDAVFSSFTFVCTVSPAGGCDSETGLASPCPDAAMCFQSVGEAKVVAHIMGGDPIPGLDRPGALRFVSECACAKRGEAI